jgi:hypothetical protein
MSVDPARLVDLAEEELGLVAAGRFPELSELHDRRAAVLAALTPDAVSEADRPQLERALALQTEVGGLLARAMADTSGELVRLGRRRHAARGYAAGADASALKRP